MPSKTTDETLMPNLAKPEQKAVMNHGRTLGMLKDKIGPQSPDGWDFPDDLTDIMEGKAEG